MCFLYSRISKGLYIDEHECEYVVRYCQEVFLPCFKEFKKPLLILHWDRTWRLSPEFLASEEIPLHLVADDESIFNANDGKLYV